MFDDPTIAVRCRGLTKNFHAGGAAIRALRGIDLDVRAGELLMLVGPSGCGKTTLISVITGILDHDTGECRVFDHNWSDLPQTAKTLLRGRSMGFVFQSFNLIPTLTAQENTAVPLLIAGVRRAKALARAAEMLRLVGLEDRRRNLPAELSGGQQQRVAIARALVHEPRLVVCDEPTSALDAETGAGIMQLLRSIVASGGRTLIVVTHDSRIFHFADRMARMDDGRIQEIVEPPLGGERN